jgi:hypothetical protein
MLNTWSSIAPPGEPRMEHAAVRLADGKVLVGGGAHTWLYDPSSQRWTQRGDPVVLRGSYTMTLLPNGKVLMTGGEGSNGSIREAELYDPTTGTWALTSPMNHPRWRHTATRLLNDKVLVVGPEQFNVPGLTCELYPPTP